MGDSAAFDALAAGYDEQFAHRAPAAWLRDAVRRRVQPLFSKGAKVIELGCGTGEDATWLAENGAYVWALDASVAMLETARAKAVANGGADRIALQQLDLADWHEDDIPDAFAADLVFSNFGALNCIGDLAPVLRTAGKVLRPRGYLAVVVMGRFCLSETLYFLLRGRIGKATRRWLGRASFRVGTQTYPVWYHSPSRISKQAPDFDRIAVWGIGALLPPSEGYWLCERWPGIFLRLSRLDEKLARILYPLSDHYLIVLQKQGETA